MSPGDNQFKKGTLEGSRQEFCCKRTEEDHTKVVQSTHGVRGEAWGGRHRGTGGEGYATFSCHPVQPWGQWRWGWRKKNKVWASMGSDKSCLEMGANLSLPLSTF